MTTDKPMDRVGDVEELVKAAQTWADQHHGGATYSDECPLCRAYMKAAWRFAGQFLKPTEPAQ